MRVYEACSASTRDPVELVCLTPINRGLASLPSALVFKLPRIAAREADGL